MHTKQIYVDAIATINLRQIIKMAEQIHKKINSNNRHNRDWSEVARIVQSIMHLYELEYM